MNRVKLLNIEIDNPSFRQLLKKTNFGVVFMPSIDAFM